MRHFLFLIVFGSMSAASASLLAECKANRISISVTSGKTARQSVVTLNGVESIASRLMEEGRVTYKTPSFKLEVLGNHRQMGNPIGYLTVGTKRSVVVCSEGIDIEKIADDTEMY